MDTLDQMKEQLKLLHNLLDQQPIVNDRHIRAAIHRSMHAINRQALALAVVGVIAIPYCAWVLHWLGLSWPLDIVTVAFIALSLAYNLWAHSGVKRSRLETEPLRQVAWRVARMKQRYARWLYFSVPFQLVWMGWLVYELLYRTDWPMDERIGVAGAALVGGLIGAILGLIAYRRTQRLARNILAQIEEYDTTDHHEDGSPEKAVDEDQETAPRAPKSPSEVAPKQK